MIPEGNEGLKVFWYRTCIGLVVVSALFTFAVAVVLAVNHLRLKEADPLNAESLQALRERYKTDPQDQELIEEIRQLDLLARRAWLGTSRSQVRGVYLLLAGSLVLVLSLKTVTTIQSGRKGRLLKKRIAEAPFRHGWWIGAALVAGVAAGALLLGVKGRPPPENPIQRTEAGDKAPGVAQEEGSAPGDDLRDKALRQWPSFRGPDGLARALAGPWPTRWDGATGEGVLWKADVPLGGRSSPVVWEDSIFLSGGDESALEVYCYDAGAGNLRWRHRVNEAAPGHRPTVTDDTGHAAPTMATDGERVYAVFSTGDLVALDFDGGLVWQADLGPPDNPYGHASSLITYNGLLFVLYDHWASASLMAFSGSTGELVWETFRDMDISWTSPIIIRPPDRDQLVVSGNPYVAGYNPHTGEELWRVAALSGEVASSPAWAGSTVLSANEYATLAAISMEGEPGIVWEYNLDLPEVSSVLSVGRRVYMANGSGTVTCLDMRSGSVLWRHEFDEGFYSSPVLAGDKIYLLDRSGTMQIFADGDIFEPVASCPLGETANCTAAFVDGRIYLRGETGLYCIGGEAQ